jgi:hypothetical protein
LSETAEQSFSLGKVFLLNDRLTRTEIQGFLALAEDDLVEAFDERGLRWCGRIEIVVPERGLLSTTNRHAASLARQGTGAVGCRVFEIFANKTETG